VPGETGSKLSTNESVPNPGSTFVCAKLEFALDELEVDTEETALLELEETLDTREELELDELSNELELLLALLTVTTVPLEYCNIQS